MGRLRIERESCIGRLKSLGADRIRLCEALNRAGSPQYVGR